MRPVRSAQTLSFARSRSTNFWKLPVEVFGIQRVNGTTGYKGATPAAGLRQGC